jgi:hypothetical protein
MTDRLLRPAADQRGFSMWLVIVTMFVTAMFVAGGYAAANNDFSLSGDSRDRKPTFAAAEAGLDFYQFHLNQDPDYWLKCADVAAPNETEPSPVWDGQTSAKPWRNVPGSTAQYYVELMPANGNPRCVPNSAATMLDSETATFKVKVHGRPRPDDPSERTMMATFRRTSFLDFLYFTDYETLDPIAYSNQSWANTNCADKVRAQRHSDCSEIVFFDDDAIKGPFHSNDTMLTCGRPTFGRPSHEDRMTVSGPTPGYRINDGCANVRPNFQGDFTFAQPKVNMPPTNSELREIADPAYRFTGVTSIRFSDNSSNMTVTNGGTTRTMALPPNGVIYVQNGTASCTPSRPPATGYSESASCGNLYVSGIYEQSMTLAAQNDIVVRPLGTNNGSLTKGNDSAVLGLIANNFVRVYHPVENPGSSCDDNLPGSMTNGLHIEAAILTLKHSFIVDNYACGDDMGTLRVTGAIAQKYRGPVGTFNRSTNTAVTGYVKDYNYDDRLRYRTPPYFLQPESAAWTVVSSHEQVGT